MLVLIIFGALLVPTILFLIALQKALAACSPGSRRMPPSNVWLLFIPIFNIVYQFIVVGAVSESLQAEFRLRNMPLQGDAGKSLGIAWCVLGLCGIIPFLGILAGLASLICWILYWVRIAEHTRQLQPFGTQTN